MNQSRNADRRSLTVLLVLFFAAAASTFMVACTDDNDELDRSALEPGRMIQPERNVDLEARGDVSEPSSVDEGTLYTPNEGSSVTFDNDVPSDRTASNVELGEDFETSGDYGESLDEFEPVTNEEVEISAASDDEILIEGPGFDDSGADFDLDDDGTFEPVANEEVDSGESFTPMVNESSAIPSDDSYLTEFEEDTETFSPVANESPSSDFGASAPECDPTSTELGSWGEPSPNRFGLGERFADARNALSSLGGSSDTLGGWGDGTELASGGWFDLSGLIAQARVALSDANDVVVARAEAGGFDVDSYEPVSVAEVESDTDDFQSVSYESDGDNACGIQTTDGFTDME